MSLHDINGSISIFAEKEIRRAVLDGKKQYATWKTLPPNAWTFLRRSFLSVAVVIADEFVHSEFAKATASSTLMIKGQG